MAELKDTNITGNLIVAGSMKKGSEEVATLNDTVANASHADNASKLEDSTKAQIIAEAVQGSVSLQASFDMARPINSTYIQYLSGDAYNPNTLFNVGGIKSKWGLLHDKTFDYLHTVDSVDQIGVGTAEQLPNIRGEAGAEYGGTGYGRSSKGCFIEDRWSGSTPPSQSFGGYILTIDAKKTLNKSQGTTINNPAYKDPVNGVPVKVRPNSRGIGVWIRQS